MLSADPNIIIPDEEVEAAARVLAHREVFNESKWREYADDARWMLNAAAQVRREWQPRP
jgi:hypothetical protein